MPSIAPAAIAVTTLNVSIASVIVGASKATRRSATRPTVGITAVASARWVASNSTSTRCGRATGSAVRPALAMARLAASLITVDVLAGGVHTAGYLLT